MARRTSRRLIWIFDLPLPASTRLSWAACLERDGLVTCIYLSPHVPFEVVWIIWDQLTADERLLWTETPTVPPPPDLHDDHSQVATP